MNLRLPDAQLKRLVIERMRITAGATIPDRALMDADVVTQVSYIADTFTYQLTTFMAAHTDTCTDERETGSIQVPATWWDHVKERFAPPWFLARYPVKHTRIVTTVLRTTTTTNVCPYIPPPKADQGYYEFLEYGPKK